MKTALRTWIKTLKPYQNGIAEKRGEITVHMNNVHALQTFASSSKPTFDSPMFSHIRVEYSKGLASHAMNQRII
jgi:hypothetical protein